MDEALLPPVPCARMVDNYDCELRGIDHGQNSSRGKREAGAPHTHREPPRVQVPCQARRSCPRSQCRPWYCRSRSLCHSRSSIPAAAHLRRCERCCTLHRRGERASCRDTAAGLSPPRTCASCRHPPPTRMRPAPSAQRSWSGSGARSSWQAAVAAAVVGLGGHNDDAADRGGSARCTCTAWVWGR